MAQQTNLNVSPYFDDFDPNDNYHRVLFKPGYPVQARELTGLQSILQNQIERFGQHFFKEGAKVIPGNTAYSRTYYALELNNTHLGVPVEYYIEQLKDRKIIGLTSGVTAFVKDVLTSADSERGNLTLYLSYLSSGVQDSELKEFLDGELLAADVDVISGPLNNPFIPIGESFASTIASNCNSTGAAFSISNGVYFVRGNFVNVEDETIILSQYSDNPTGRVGLRVLEEIINSDLDENLTDNSKGFNNFASPGADRLKISCSLTFKSIDDLNDSDFVELATVRDGTLESQTKNTEYSIIADELARRTYAESGDYTVDSFNVSIRESLNDGISNNGIYEEGKFTQGGSIASRDLALYEIGPGKAFVKGYEVETINTTYLDVEKPRTTKTLENQDIIYNTGATFKVNNSFGVPITGIGNTYIVSLRNQRVGFNSLSAPGSEIGLARVYDYALESGSYSATNDRVNQWDLQLYDIQTFTTIQVNEPVTLTIPTFVKGKYSGATGFLRSAVSAGTELSVYETTGDFAQAEPLIFDGIDNSRVAVAVTSFGIKDVKSVYGGGDLGAVGSATTFSADTVLEPIVTIGIATITPTSGATGISTVIANSNFLSKVKLNDIIRYTNTTQTTDVPTLSRVTGLGLTSATIVGIETVSGVANGNLPSGSILSVTDLAIVGTKLSAEVEDLDARALYTTMPKQLISDVDLTGAEIRIRKTFTVNISNNQLSSVLSAAANETFLPFDEERYTLVRSDGRTVELTSDKFVFTNGSTELQINNIGSDDTGATLHATLKKQKIKEKVKRKNRINTLIIDKSKIEGSGSTNRTLNNGLSFGNFPFGSRVEDEKISLNTPDVLDVLGIYESRDTSAASSPRMTLSALSSFGGKTSDLTIGETIVGQLSGAKAYYAEKISDSVISYLPRTEVNFQEGETVTFEESNVTAILTTLNNTSNAIAGNFTFNNGQRSSIYGHGFIKRNSDAKAPTRQLKIYFSSGYYDPADDGDLTTRNSYNSFDYETDIQTVNGERNTDLIDIRPRVSDYTVSADTRSPLEFLGRSYDGNGNSAANILASDEAINLDFSFYLGRLDRIFITKEGKFQVQQGVPSETYEKPVKIDDALEIATIRLHPYLLDITEDSSISFLDHKRYRMSDIKLLEDRIRSLEYYTTLSLLEVNTENLFVTDSDGLNRFKSGFFVDDFTTLLPQESDAPLKNSIDDANRELRPRHFTNSIDLTIEPVEGVTTQTDVKFTPPEGENIKRMGDVITLDYEEIEWLKQGFATRTESITPFLVSFWQASIELSPASDTWVDTARIEAKVINVEGNYAVEMAKATRQFGAPDPQTGFFPIQWGSWETNWTGRESRTRTQTRSHTRGGGGGRRTVHRSRTAHHGGGWRLRRVQRSTRTTTTIQDTVRDTWRTGTDTKSGERTVITERFDRESQGDRVISREVISIMRSRNVEFVAKKARPLTRMYAFFDGRDVSRYCVPKLLEIAMTSGVFQVGETVVGKMKDVGLGNANIASPEIQFRVATANHREGPFNAPTQIFKNNPYLSQVSPTEVETFLGNPGQVQVPGQANVLPDSYSSTSTILNVDTGALSLQAQGDYYGYVAKDMVLVGQTSGAQATISNLRLQTDLGANLIGSFFIPNPNIGGNPRFETGSKTFTLIDNDDNDQNGASSIGEQKYSATGTLETVQEQIISVRNAGIQVKQEVQRRSAREFLGSTVLASNVIDSVTTVDETVIWWDPLAQSFQVLDSTGVFITSCDVFFQTKDDMDIPMTFQIRTMQNGVPTQKILPFSEIVKDPDEINISQDGTVPTTFEFKAPVYLEPGGEYAITLASWSTKYRVFISRVGESDILTDEFISNQPYLGSLFKSQNASTWEPSQWEDLKFTIRRADFVPDGSLEIYSPILGEGNGQIPTLQPNSLSYNSKKVRVGLGSTLQIGEALNLGNIFSQQTTTATGRFVGAAGSATGTMTLVNAGLGYTPDSGGQTYPNITFTNITGTGQDLTAEVTITNGVAVAATVTNAGRGYVIGDVLELPPVGATPAGRNARFSVAGIAATSELIFDNVQGDFVVGAGKTLRFTANDGTVTTLNATSGGNVVPTSITDVGEHNGLHFTVNHKNHGMYHENNRVIVSNVESDITPTKLTSPYAADSTASILIDDESNFGTFENIGVAATVPGFVRIGDEIIQYTSTASGELSGITRSVDGTTAQNYVVGTPVYKYETGGVSLRRINKTHLLSDTDSTISNPITYDSYTIKVDMANNGFDRSNQDSFPKLYFNDTKSTGGYKIKATQNMPFEAIVPQVQNLTVPGTTVSAKIRTTSGSNLGDGSGTTLPVPFQDKGVQDVTLNSTNYLDSPRIIASRVNETNSAVLQELPGDRSFNMSVTLRSEDSRLSPVVDAQRMSAILISNRVDSPISNFIEDSRVNTIDEDPTAFQYISKENSLESSATSIKILLSAHINEYTDIRAFYAIGNEQDFEPIFEAFPGYASLNDGTSDRKIPPSNASEGFDSADLTFKEYEFSVDDLPSFKSYRIKLVSTSTNQAYAPRIRDLRTIALA